MQCNCGKCSCLFSNVFTYSWTRYYFRVCVRHKNKLAVTFITTHHYDVMTRKAFLSFYGYPHKGPATRNIDGWCVASLTSRGTTTRGAGDFLTDTLRHNHVVITSNQRHFDVITSKWRRFDVITTSSSRHVFGGLRRHDAHVTLL